MDPHSKAHSVPKRQCHRHAFGTWPVRSRRCDHAFHLRRKHTQLSEIFKVRAKDNDKDEDKDAEETRQRKQEERREKEIAKDFDPKVQGVVFEACGIALTGTPYSNALLQERTCAAICTLVLIPAFFVKDFSLPTAVVLGCCSFEAYNAPYSSHGLKEVSPCGTETIYMDKDFLTKQIVGVLEVYPFCLHATAPNSARSIVKLRKSLVSPSD